MSFVSTATTTDKPFGPEAAEGELIIVNNAGLVSLVGISTIIFSEAGTHQLFHSFTVTATDLAAANPDIVIQPAGPGYLAATIDIEGVSTVDMSGWSGNASVTVTMDASEEADWTGGQPMTLIGSIFGDTITGPGFIDGGLGNDTLTGWTGADTIFGGSGADMIDGGAGNDTIEGGDDHDTLDGGAGIDNVSGGAGNDLIRLWSGGDTADGGDGFDTLDLSNHESGPTQLIVNLHEGWFQARNGEVGQISGFESVIGSGGADVLIGGAANDVISGGFSNDWIDDLGGGDDQFSGGDGSDSLYGRDGNDSLDGGAGNDLLDGGAGDDTLMAGLGNNIIAGGDGLDTVSYAWIPDRIWLDLAAGVFAEDGVWDVLSGVESVIGGANSDALFGDAAGNTLSGDGGNDVLVGREGDDTLIGGAHNDWLDGGDGDDVLEGGSGVNILNGGAGVDLASYASATTDLWIDMAAGVYAATGVWDVFNESIEGAIGGSGADVMLASAAGSVLRGEDGADTLIGGVGDDDLMGGAGDDWIVGGAGNDRLSGGAGTDFYTAGEGADTFALGADAGWDVAYDFDQSEDVFDLGGGVWLDRVEGDLDGDGQADDTMLTHGGGTFVALGVTGLSLTEWNALVTG